ncbi:MAG: TetR/AcrR family transcriptional regulator [candidate division Zixibacteria bacterium]|nr:TetR/AcrR family transcriptional regulator [candidate division Zixibacteria bacterium]
MTITKEKLISKRNRQILTASMKVFSRYGYQNTDVEKIAHLAGLGKGTVYRYFKSKENLFLSTLEWGLNSLKDEIVDAVNKVDDYPEKVRTALAVYLSFFEKNRDFYRLLIQERIWAEVKSAGWRWKEKHLSHIDHLEKILAEGMKRGYFKRVDPSSCAFALWGLTNSLLYKWLLSEKKYPMEREISVIKETFFEGLLKKKTRRKR